MLEQQILYHAADNNMSWQHSGQEAWVVLTAGASVTVKGAVDTPVFIIATSPSALSVSLPGERTKTLHLVPYSLTVISTELERFHCSTQSELLILQASATSEAIGLFRLEQPMLQFNHQDIVNIAVMMRRHLQMESVTDDSYLGCCIRMLQCRAQKYAMATKTRSGNDMNQSEFTTLLEEIDDQIEQVESVSALASLMAMTPTQCSRVIRNRLGLSPMEYVRERRLARAREMLASTETSIAEIALKCGYCSQAHMTATFSRVIGISPARYRRASQ